VNRASIDIIVSFSFLAPHSANSPMRTRLRAHRKRATRGAFELVETGACGCTRAQVFILMHSLPRVALLLGYRRMRALYPQFYVRSSDKTALSLFVSLPPSLPPFPSDAARPMRGCWTRTFIARSLSRYRDASVSRVSDSCRCSRFFRRNRVPIRRNDVLVRHPIEHRRA